jgi:type VI secretion system protein ImpB
MSQEVSVAPKERINIVYKSSTGDQQEQVELPLKLLVVGDFTNGVMSDTLSERSPININKTNFNAVLKDHKIKLALTVPDRLSQQENASLSVELNVNSIEDFEPDHLVNNVPELKKLLSLRDALKGLKAPLGNVPAFRKRLAEIVADDAARQQILSELNITE